ncbi:uncharacterized protein E0L32_000342 [Thyridium curvatum]|uniref:Acyl-CoA thioesterase n=1 Tax=Thyridium curvatum TaxID=1093900 RepID=A0A507BH07_9PEZI|nr:uncharacterized protein E0L32_000342 [Thyridium curvatum]TPX16008.1 hypothetical protein E0L32_000342 [Thyridium curvatum]
MPPSLAQQVAVDKLPGGDGGDEFVSRELPIRLGNALPIAYGGCAIANAVSAACATVPARVHLYSVLGNFLGPALTDRKLYCSVHRTRDTRSFSTRRVQVSQRLDGGERRVCLELLADFHADEPSTLEYSARPAAAYAPPHNCPGLEEQMGILRSQGLVSDGEAAEFQRSLGAQAHYWDMRYCANGVAGQNLAGVLKSAPTTQDGLRPTEKVSAEWQRAREALASEAENMAALAFLMDAAISFVPLTHGNMWFDDAAACSSLDFALRVFAPGVDMRRWTLRERGVSRAGMGRSYGEALLWDDKGNLLASMTQQSILRLKKGVTPPKASL